MTAARPLLQIVHATGFALGEHGEHLASAHRFGRFVRAIAATDAIWRKHPTWFVASSLGPVEWPTHDPRRLALVDALAPRDVCAARLVLPSPRDRRDPRRAIVWPTIPFTARSHDARIEVQLYGLDTSDGAVDADAYARLGRLQSMHRGGESTRAMTIVASEHPIAALLEDRRSEARAHLHLAGHTPRVEPIHGRRDRPRYLAPGSFSEGIAPWRGTAAVIRLYTTTTSTTLLCERLVAARRSDTDAWGWLPDANGDVVADEWAITL